MQALVMLGLNGGASLVPYMTTLVWARATPVPAFSGAVLLSMTAPAVALGLLFRRARSRPAELVPEVVPEEEEWGTFI